MLHNSCTQYNIPGLLLYVCHCRKELRGTLWRREVTMRFSRIQQEKWTIKQHQLLWEAYFYCKKKDTNLRIKRVEQCCKICVNDTSNVPSFLVKLQFINKSVNPYSNTITPLHLLLFQRFLFISVFRLFTPSLHFSIYRISLPLYSLTSLLLSLFFLNTLHIPRFITSETRQETFNLTKLYYVRPGNGLNKKIVIKIPDIWRLQFGASLAHGVWFT